MIWLLMAAVSLIVSHQPSPAISARVPPAQEPCILYECLTRKIDLLARNSDIERLNKAKARCIEFNCIGFWEAVDEYTRSILRECGPNACDDIRAQRQ